MERSLNYQTISTIEMRNTILFDHLETKKKKDQVDPRFTVYIRI